MTSPFKGPIEELFGPESEAGYSWASLAHNGCCERRYSRTLRQLVVDKLKDRIKYAVVEQEDNIDAATYVFGWVLKAPFYLALYLLMTFFILTVFVPLWYLGAGIRRVFRRVV